MARLQCWVGSSDPRVTDGGKCRLIIDRQPFAPSADDDPPWAPGYSWCVSGTRCRLPFGLWDSESRRDGYVVSAKAPSGILARCVRCEPCILGRTPRWRGHLHERRLRSRVQTTPYDPLARVPKGWRKVPSRASGGEILRTGASRTVSLGRRHTTTPGRRSAVPPHGLRRQRPVPSGPQLQYRRPDNTRSRRVSQVRLRAG